MADSLERFVKGFVAPEEWQSFETQGDIQIAALKIALTQALSDAPDSVALFDVGMGTGLIAKLCSELNIFSSKNAKYVGVDINISGQSIVNSGIKTDFLPTGRASYVRINDFPSILLTNSDRIIVLRNVVHEMGLVNFCDIIKSATINAKSLKIIIQDMEKLPTAELGQHPWSIDIILDVLKNIGFADIDYVPEISRSGIPFFTLWFKGNFFNDISFLDAVSNAISLHIKEIDIVAKSISNFKSKSLIKS